MQKMLITFGTRPLAQRLSKILNTHFEIIFATSEEVPSFLSANYNTIPTAANPTFAHELLKLCLDKQIDFLLPLGLAEINALTEAKILLEEYGTKLLSPSKEELEELFVLENPPSNIDLILCEKGVNLISDSKLEIEMTGLFAVSDEGDDLALCTIK